MLLTSKNLSATYRQRPGGGSKMPNPQLTLPHEFAFGRQTLDGLVLKFESPDGNGSLIRNLSSASDRQAVMGGSRPRLFADKSPGSLSIPLAVEIKREPDESPKSSPLNVSSSNDIHGFDGGIKEDSNSSQTFHVNSPPPKSLDTRQRQKIQDELCLVCGDRASGYHYNTLACEGCKGFFRRSITQSKSSKYLCKYGDNCDIDMYMRRKCQACRLKKCYTVGMRADCLVPEDQCRRKRQVKKEMKSSPSFSNSNTPNNNNIDEQMDDHFFKEELNLKTDVYFPTDLSPIQFYKRLKPEQEELINRLVYFQEEFEQPSEDDLKKVYHVPICTNVSDIDESESLFRHITEITILTVQLIVQFSRHLPGFQTLNRADQVILLKACSSEVMMIRASRRYDIQSDSIVFATNHPFTRDHYVKAGLDNEGLFQFCRRMSKMKVDNAEYGLLTAITIFSARKNLCDPHRVEKIQEIYVDALQAYMQANRRKQPMIALAKLLSILADLRSLGNNNSRQCFDLKLVANRKLPQFLAEIWDIV